jgi:DNA invertase Pin-like site-specific DNA recombinase
MKAAIYARVSTKDQDCQNQLLQLRQFAATQGWAIIAEYSDELSSSTSDRPQFKAMFMAASRRQFDVSLFWSLDRLSREGVLDTLQHLNRLTGHGVAWRSYTEQYLDSTGMFRDAVIGILAAVAKQERVRRSERTRAGLERARADGTQDQNTILKTAAGGAEVCYAVCVPESPEENSGLIMVAAGTSDGCAGCPAPTTSQSYRTGRRW